MTLRFDRKKVGSIPTSPAKFLPAADQQLCPVHSGRFHLRQTNPRGSLINTVAIEKQSTKIKGGKRPGAGRKPGVPNKRTAETQQAVEESGLTPLEYMLSVMRDVGQDEQRRLAAANMAAPYVHAKLSSVELTGKDGGAMETVTRVELVPLTK